MTVLHYSEDSSEDQSCIVKINGNEILVEYKDEEIVQYRGRNNGNGHFELSAPAVQGKASLHMCSPPELLEGSWVEKGCRGMWKITLRR
jgi:hypothetical protein